MRGMCPAAEECKEGLKRRRLKPLDPSWFESSCQSLREQDSNLQPCGYGMLQCFRIGPDYLIIL